MEILELSDPSRLEELREKAKQELIELQAGAAPEIKRAAQWLRRCQRVLSALKDQGYDLTDATMGSYLFVYGVLFPFLILESLANAYFIGQGSDLGLLGGAIGAFFIASLSIALSFTAGMGVRAILGEGIVRRVLAFLMGIVYAGGIVVYHTIIGWYRAALVYGNPDTAVSDALVNFASYAFSLPDLYSYGLAIVGLFFAGIAFLAGFESKDARMKARLARKVNEKGDAEANYNSVIKFYTSGVVSVYTEPLAEMEDRVKSACENAHELRLVLLEIDKDQNEFRYLIREIRYTQLYATGLLRCSNLAVRDTPAPKYFNEDPLSLEIDEFEFDPQLVENARQAIKNIEKRLQELRQVAKTEKTRIRFDYEEALKSMPAFIYSLCSEPAGESFFTGRIGTEADAEHSDDEPRFKVVDRQQKKEVSHVYA